MAQPSLGLSNTCSQTGVIRTFGLARRAGVRRT
jgi:hypothetical protein